MIFHISIVFVVSLPIINVRNFVLFTPLYGGGIGRNEVALF